MVKMICFDMDGTLANLYNVPDWEKKLNMGDFTPYLDAEPMFNMSHLAQLTKTLIKSNIEVRIISWSAMHATTTQTKIVKMVKKAWLEKYGFNYTNLHVVKYGTTKSNVIRKYLSENETAILVDDNEKILNGWNVGAAIKPEEIFNLEKYICGKP